MNTPKGPKAPSALEARVAELIALVAELRDPTKTAPPPPAADKDKDKPPTQFIKAPRDANNNVTHWITGMQPCKCKKKQPDFFTKPMKNWKQFSGFRRRVMNEPDTDTA